jgi:pimeloyl-ACP methyl ester carboxylesterase
MSPDPFFDPSDLAQIETFRRTLDTSVGPVSCLDVGDGPVALFIHGVGTNALLWRHVLGALADERRCVAIDLPLHGQTPAPVGRELDLAAMADAVEAFCQAADFDVVDLVANDTGGAVAQIFAARHPQRLRSLCLTNCDAHDNIPPDAFAPTVELAAAGGIEAGAGDLLADLAGARAAVFAMGYEDPDQPPLDVVARFLEPVLSTPERARAFEHLLVSMKPDDLLSIEADLAAITAPTLVVWGTADDFFALSWAHWLDHLIAGSTGVVEVEGARLFFVDERADDLVAALRPLWARATDPVVA